MTTQEYDNGFSDGLAAAITIIRAGATPDDLGILLPEDPGQTDRQKYQDHLSELRKALNMGFGDLPPSEMDTRC